VTSEKQREFQKKWENYTACVRIDLSHTSNINTTANTLNKTEKVQEEQHKRETSRCKNSQSKLLMTPCFTMSSLNKMNKTQESSSQQDSIEEKSEEGKKEFHSLPL